MCQTYIDSFVYYIIINNDLFMYQNINIDIYIYIYIYLKNNDLFLYVNLGCV